MNESYEWSSLASATRHMAALDYDGVAYVVERIKLSSGVVVRAKDGPGFDVWRHNSQWVRLGVSSLGPQSGFIVRAYQIAAVYVAAL